MEGSSSNETDTLFAAENDMFYASNIYKPLAAEKQAIRLLKILPGIEGSKVRCELMTSVSLTSRHVPLPSIVVFSRQPQGHGENKSSRRRVQHL